MQNLEKKISGDLVKGHPSAKFGINLLDVFSENRFHGRRTTRAYDGWTDDGRLCDDSSCAVQQNKAELKT